MYPPYLFSVTLLPGMMYVRMRYIEKIQELFLAAAKLVGPARLRIFTEAFVAV
jgi:hypothetical protein